MAYTVGEVARLARVSIRALHHYDEIGLLTPSDRSEAGYRLYSAEDLERLQQILFFKELGFGLEEIRRVMLEPGFDRHEALVTQRKLLAERLRRTQAMLAAVEQALEVFEKGTPMKTEELFEVFGEFNPEDHREEVHARFAPELVAESERRTGRYTKSDWKEIQARQGAIYTKLAGRMECDPGDAEVQDLVEQHRRLIDERFYPCSREIHAGLGQMYVSDPRFTAFFDKIRPGLAQFACEAMQVAARRAAGQGQ